MTRLLRRYYGCGDLHFITCSCYQRRPFLGTVRRRDLFLTVLEQVRRGYRFVVLGYVVMPEHFHVAGQRTAARHAFDRPAGGETGFHAAGAGGVAASRSSGAGVAFEHTPIGRRV
jgi:hypothetical protein